MKVLLVEDEAQIASFVIKGLQEAGFVVDHCDNGDEGWERIHQGSYDALVLDIMLPGRDGLSILRELRQEKNGTPVILLTARASLDERVEGLNTGADDYLTKPFYIEELIARLHAQIRRKTGTEQSSITAGKLYVDLLKRSVIYDEQPRDLSSREFNLLTYLLRSPGRVYSRTQILEHVWEYHFDPETNIVDVYIQRLRKKVGAPRNELIETVRGVGYRIAVSDET